MPLYFHCKNSLLQLCSEAPLAISIRDGRWLLKVKVSVLTAWVLTAQLWRCLFPPTSSMKPSVVSRVPASNQCQRKKRRKSWTPQLQFCLIKKKDQDGGELIIQHWSHLGPFQSRLGVVKFCSLITTDISPWDVLLFCCCSTWTPPLFSNETNILAVDHFCFYKKIITVFSILALI